ncbi:MAG: hypothetical protein LAT64_09540 [Phycisphaerales bacterium]|nr:hypothetical protein [Planctomycetota bacterium]MCH8508990.1 hypothetical protein [Phycisphaerales bacterium]
MLRSILSVVLGYLAIFILVFLGLTIGYFALGADRAFRPGSYQVSGLWIGVWAAISLAAALAGGAVCAKIARAKTPVLALAGIVLVIGLLQAAGAALATRPDDPAAREPGTPFAEVLSNARSPVWVAFITPLLGATGVLLGGSAFAQSARKTPED